MNYWITSHYPPHDRRYYAGIWVQDGKERAASGMKPGDMVFKYECQTGPTLKITRPNGTIVTQACPRGHKGIVAIREVTSDLSLQKDSNPTEYTEGSKWWRYHADADCIDTDGFVPLTELNVLLGYSPNYNMRGFGEASSGLKRISKETFDEIYAAFKQGKTS